MIDEILRSYALTLDHLFRLLTDVPDDALTRQPHGAVNHPAWTIGHLTYSCQAIGGELGLPEWLPADWPKQFGTGSTPVADRSAYPSKSELLAALTDGRRRLENRLHELGEAEMNAPLPDIRYRETFPTIGHAVLHILTAHVAYHVGQVSIWRRAAGYPPLSKMFV